MNKTFTFLLIVLSILGWNIKAQTPQMIKGGWYSSPEYLTDVNGTLFFVADDGTHGKELWKSNGTTNGTLLVKDINPGSGTSNPHNLVNLNGTLFFTVDGIEGVELWKSNGTDGGTVIVKDINQGNSSSNPSNLTSVGGTLFFTADDGINGNELWKSDGTSAGTVLVKDIKLGSDNSYPSYLTNVNGTLFFVANDGTNTGGLWKSDGTSAGTVLVKNLVSSFPGSGPHMLINVNGILYCFLYMNNGSEELWRSDGSEGGTMKVTSITFYSSSLSGQLSINNTLYFIADDFSGYGAELWKSDGNGTQMIKDINPGSSGAFPTMSNGVVLSNVNGVLFFSADDGTHGMELWKSDGTNTGTVLVSDINPGFFTSGITYYWRERAVISGKLYFSADDGTTGIELWKSDGTNTGTQLVKDINLGSGDSEPEEIINSGGKLFFTAYNGSDVELWGENSASGIAFNENNQSVIVFPNPNNGRFKIDLGNSSKKPLFIKITNTLGSTIYSSQMVVNNFEINLQGQPSGVYFYEVQNGSKILGSGKFIIE